MPQSFLDQLHQLQTFPQLQQQPNQSPAPAAPAASAEAEPDDLELDPSELAPDDDDHDVAETAESSQPVAPAAGPDPLRAERRRNNQLEKELRTLRTQLARFSEINPDEYARLQETERQKQELERQIQQRESQLSDAHTRRVRTVEKERDDARQQILDLRKERLLERLFHDAEGRVGGDDRGSFFEIFKAQCGTMFRLAKDKTGRDQLEPIDHDGNPLIGEQGAVSSADLIEDLRGHAVLGFLFQQRGGPFPNAMPDRSFDGSDDPVNLQAMSSSELYLAAVRKTTPTARAGALITAIVPFLLVFWRNRSTATVVTAGSNVQARGRAKAKARSGYGSIVSVRRANPQDSRLIRKGTWVRRRRNGSSPQFGTAASKASARRIRSRYCPELVRRTR